jgi:hypothetical protein
MVVEVEDDPPSFLVAAQQERRRQRQGFGVVSLRVDVDGPRRFDQGVQPVQRRLGDAVELHPAHSDRREHLVAHRKGPDQRVAADGTGGRGIEFEEHFVERVGELGGVERVARLLVALEERARTSERTAGGLAGDGGMSASSLGSHRVGEVVEHRDRCVQVTEFRCTAGLAQRAHEPRHHRLFAIAEDVVSGGGDGDDGPATALRMG